ncbi:MAG: hypothetical protein ACKN9E_13445 [Microcystaceae cyanobacterium]
MKTSYKDGKLCLNLVDLISAMSDEEQLNLVESLACHEAVIKFVMQQVIEGWTTNGYRGLKGAVEVEPTTELEKAIRQIAIHSSQIAQQEIARLCSKISQLEQEQKSMIESAVTNP